MSKVKRIVWVITFSVVVVLLLVTFSTPLLNTVKGLVPSGDASMSRGQGGILDVVPGKSVGPIVIGMSSVEVYRALGTPAKLSSFGREVWSYGEDFAVVIYDNKVIGVQMLRPGRIQKDGRTLDASSTGKNVEAIFGTPDFMSGWTDDKNRVEQTVRGYRALGFGVLANPKTDQIVGYIVTVPEPAPKSSSGSSAVP